MRIKIANRFRPFSHQPGIQVVVPGTTSILQCYPTKCFLDGKEMELHLPAIGPPKNFTVIQDLERGEVKFFAHYPSGYEERVICLSERKNVPRLSLGVDKKGDWNLVVQRGLLAEILPYWYRLGKLTPASNAIEAFENQDLLTLFQAHFSGIFVPHSEDIHHLGVPPFNEEAWTLLSGGAVLIEQLFIQWKEDVLHILPKLPVQLHCGRLIDLFFEGIGTLHIEWTKKKIRRVIIEPICDRILTLNIAKKPFECRLTQNLKKKSQKIDLSKPLSLYAGKTVQLDRFQF